MPHLKKSDTVRRVTYRPEQRVCSTCHSLLKRDHILWRKYVLFSTGAQVVTSWAYRCPRADCPGVTSVYRSAIAEKLHLRQRRFSRELRVLQNAVGVVGAALGERLIMRQWQFYRVPL